MAGAGKDLLTGACSMMGKIPVLLGPRGPALAPQALLRFGQGLGFPPLSYPSAFGEADLDPDW